jgi:hypothetical protein
VKNDLKWTSRWSVRQALAAFMFFVAMATVSVVARAETPWVAIVGGDTRALALARAGAGYENATFQLVHAAPHGGFKVERADVRRGTASFAADAKTFVPLVASDSLSVSFEVSRVVPPGTYEIQTVATADKVTATTLTFHLVVPTAQARLPELLVVDAVIPTFAVFDEDAGAAATVPLVETSGLAPLTNLQVTPVGGTVVDGRPTLGSLTLDAGFSSVDPGGVTLLAVTVKNCELGTTTGHLQVGATELAQPVDLHFQVKARRSPCLIWFLIAAGIAAGAAIRLGLEKLVTRGGLVEAALQLRKRAVLERARHYDARTRVAIDEQVTLIDAAVVEHDAELKTICNTALSKLQTALDLLTKRRDAARASLDDLVSVLAAPWNLPSGLRQIVERATGQSGAIRLLFEVDDIGAVEEEFALASTAIAASLGAEAQKWAETVNAIAHALPAPVASLPGIDEDTPAATELVKRLRLVAEAASVATPVLKTLLEACHNARSTVVNLAMRGLAMLDHVALDAETEFAGRPAVMQAFETARAELKELRRSMDVERDGPERVLEHIANRFVASLTDALRHATTDGTLDAEVTVLLSEGKYVAAARKVAVANAAAPAPTRSPRLESMPLAPSHKADTAVAVPSATRPPQVTIRAAASPPSRPASLLSVARFGIWAGRGARVVQWLLISVLVATTGYALYAPTFVGRLPEMVGILLWAFSLNIGVDAVLEQSKKLTARS